MGRFRLRLHGWSVKRRLGALRRRIQKGRAFVAGSTGAVHAIWRDCNRRADVENGSAEWKHDLSADGFCPKQFFSTGAAFLAVPPLFNLLVGFQRAAGGDVSLQAYSLLQGNVRTGL